MYRVIILLIALLLGPVVGGTSPSIAQELIISGNGSDSDNEITIEVPTTTEVSQSNDAEIKNDIEVKSDTGNNEVKDNTDADISIETGNIEDNVSVENKDINQSIVSQECCPTEPSEIRISDNGSDSDNSINIDNSSKTEVEVNNEADIENKVSGFSNTGKNTAKDNTDGDIEINTGDISVEDSIINKDINNASIFIAQGNEEVDADISDNGADSDNSIEVNKDKHVFILVNNDADLKNFDEWYANTGDNFAKGNVGDVSITTGDISIDKEIRNEGINVSVVSVVCCPTITPTPTPTPGENGNGNGNGQPEQPGQPGQPAAVTQPGPQVTEAVAGQPGEVLAAAAAAPFGEVLPISGDYLTFLLTIVAIIMFLLGLYIRLHPGRDPSNG